MGIFGQIWVKMGSFGIGGKFGGNLEDLVANLGGFWGKFWGNLGRNLGVVWEDGRAVLGAKMDNLGQIWVKMCSFGIRGGIWGIWGKCGAFGVQFGGQFGGFGGLFGFFCVHFGWKQC